MWKIFNFIYLRIALRPKFFLGRSHQMFFVPWSGSLRNMFVSHTAPCHTNGTSGKLFHPYPYTHDTSAAYQTG